MVYIERLDEFLCRSIAAIRRQLMRPAIRGASG